MVRRTAGERSFTLGGGDHPGKPIGGGRRAGGAYATVLRGGHDIVPIIAEVLGGFSPGKGAGRPLSKAQGSTLQEDALTAARSARSIKAFHSQRISVALRAAVNGILDTSDKVGVSAVCLYLQTDTPYHPTLGSTANAGILR